MPECGERVTLAMQPVSRVMARVLSGTPPGPRRPGSRMPGTTPTPYFGVVVIAAGRPSGCDTTLSAFCLPSPDAAFRPPSFLQSSPMTARYIDVCLLGPIEAREASGTRLEIPRGRPLTLLALLLTRRDDIVSSDVATEALWPDRPPKDPRNALQLAVSRLRRALAGSAGSLVEPATDVVVGVAGGYSLRLPVGWVDADRFETLAQAGRAQLARNEAADAAGTLRGALSMWRGPAFADVHDEPFAQASIGRLDELRIAAIADRIDADLALRRHAQLVGELETLVGEHPLRERLRAQLMLALYGSGRQAEALAVYRDTRRLLIEELGVEPSRELRDAHQFVLRQGELPPPMAGSAPPDTVRLRSPARRRLLTCVVAVPHDVNMPGGQSDPEAVGATLLDLRSRIAGICDPYHGIVRDSEAAAFTIVFGWPHSRENDVLNAVVAARQLVRGRAGGPAGRSRAPAAAARCRRGHRGSRDDAGHRSPIPARRSRRAGRGPGARSQPGPGAGGTIHLAARLACCARVPGPGRYDPPR